MESVAIGFGLSILVGLAVGRWWAALAPILAITTLTAIRLGSTSDPGDVTTGLIVVAMLGSLGAVGAIFGVALHKALRRDPSAA
jgi:hypothetical protein